MKKGTYLILLTLFLCGCSQGNLKKHKNVVRLAFTSDIRSLEPRISGEYPSCHVINMTYEGLMRLSLDGDPVPGVARSVSISEDQKTYTFYLRNSFWSNGDPVTAYDFEYAWKKSVNPLYAKTGAFSFYAIKNVKDCLGKTVDIDQVGIKALDAKTLQVELEHPAPYFLSLCTCATYSPIHQETDQNHPEWASSLNADYVCNGPFIVKSWSRDNAIYLEKNIHYWDVETVQVHGIHIQVIPDANTQFLLFQKGELDLIGQPLNALPTEITLDRKEKGELDTIDASGVYWLFVNTEKHPYSNTHFRKAFSYAINREEITQHVFQLGEKPATGILGANLKIREKPYFKDGNHELARHHLHLALEEMELEVEDLPTIQLSHRCSEFDSRVMQVIQEQVHNVLGLKVETHQLDWPVHFSQVAKGNYEIGEMPWNSWINDPIYMLDTFRNKSASINMSRWEDPTYQELLKKSDEEIDLNQRTEYLRQAETLLMEEMPIIPICFPKIYFLKNPQLKGVYVSPLKEIDFRYSYFSE